MPFHRSNIPLIPLRTNRHNAFRLHIFQIIKKMPKKRNRPTRRQIAWSAFSAGSSAVLIVLILWGFELRSVKRLLISASLLFVPLCISFYVFLFRKERIALRLQAWVFLMGACTSILLSVWVIPDQATAARYMLTFGLVSIMCLLFYTFVFQILFHIEQIPWKTIFLWAALCGGLAGVIVIFQAGTTARIYSDGFCYAVRFADLGFIGSGMWFYRSWSGRFFSNFLVMRLADQPRTILYLILLTALSFWVLLFSLSRSPQRWRNWLVAFSGSFYLFLTLSVVPQDFYKTFLWKTAALIVFPLFILIPIYMAVFFQQLKKEGRTAAWLIVVSFFLSFLISTIHEVATPGWIGLHLAGLIWLIFHYDQHVNAKKYWIAGNAAVILGLIVMLLSPGIEIRASVQQYPLSASILDIIRITMDSFFGFLKRFSKPYYIFQRSWRPSWLLIPGVLGIGWTFLSPFRRNWRTAVLVLTLAILMSISCFIPGAYVYHSTIPLRSEMIPTFYLIFGLFFSGMLMPRPETKAVMNAVLFLMLLSMLFGMTITIQQLRQTTAPLEQHAIDWDQRDSIYKQSSETPAGIDVPWEEYESGIDCMQLYYAQFP